MNVSASFTASALTIARRRRSWMTRSNRSASAGRGRFGAAAEGLALETRDFRASATVPPGDRNAVGGEQPSEAGRKKRIRRALRPEKRRDTEPDERPAHRPD